MISPILACVDPYKAAEEMMQPYGNLISHNLLKVEIL